MKTKQILTALVTLAAIWAASTHAATITSIGSGDWYSTSPGNPWPGGTVPATTDDAVITSGVNVGTAVTINNLTINGGGTFYNGSILTVSGNLNVNGTVTVQEGAAINITGNLNIGAGTQFDPSCFPFSVGGLTTVDGTLLDLCGGAGLTDVLGDVTVDSGGQWKLTDVTQWSVSGNVVNNGTISVTTGGITFVGSSKNISGNGFSIPKMVVNGTVTNSTTLTNATSLSGSGTLTQSANSTLYIGGAVTIATLDASVNPNTVNYTGGAQSVAGPSYYNLNLSGSNTKTFASATAIGGGLNIASPVRANINSTVTASGTTTIPAGATLGGAGTLNGALVVNGTVAPGAASLGTLTLGSSPTLNGTAVMRLNRASAQNADQLAISGQPLAYAGTLTVQNTGAALVAGDTFVLFSATGYSGSFGTVTLPTLGANLAWNNTLGANGTISVVSTVAPGSPRLTNSVSGGVMTLSWDTANFPGYTLQAETNSGGVGSSPWGAVPGGTVSPVTIAISHANPSVFFRLIK